MTRCFNRLRLTGGGWDHVLHRPAYSDERWAAVGPNGPDPAPAPVNSDALINVCTNDVLHQLEERTRNGVRCTQARFRGTGTQQRSLVLATLAAPTGDVTDINALFNPGKRTASSSKKRAHSPQPEQSGADLGQDAESEGEDSPGPSLARLGVQDLTRPFWSPSPAAGAQAYVHTKAAFASLLNPLDPCQSSESATSSSNGGSKAKRESRENRKRFTYFQDKPMLKDAVANLTGLQNATTSERLSHFSKLVGTLSLEADDVPLLANHALLTPTPQDIQKVLLLAAAGVLIDLRVRQMINRLSFRPVSSSNALPSHEAPPPDSLQTRNTPYIFSLDFYARRGPYLRQLVHYLLWQSRKRRSMF